MSVIDITFSEKKEEETDEYREVFDFNSPEDVLIQVEKTEISAASNGWSKLGFCITGATVISGKEGVTGAASYEQSYGSFLEYTLENIVDCPKKEGWYVVEEVTGAYFKGDGYTSDDDMDFYCKGIRPATEQEIAMA